ncbi:hypothetical protein [Arthrobacter sp. B2a2-09]|uniref:hypothetical protein n=1 Tax=Arthrobacter sp. B2a2-09 TaxID=2952822 RepID=UPI0022CD9F8A|nr:hypothetical protein [Arthrobacter sp. B2a2-09]MCZ9882719.1 hypothetical protein [Arthrobacter sp. B2a2-09]
MTETFNGGLARPGKMMGVLGPWIVLTPSASHLDFRMRFNWMERFFGPWRLERAGVREVYMSRRTALNPLSANILAEGNMPWTFYTEHPFDVLECLDRLGYPVRMT